MKIRCDWHIHTGSSCDEACLAVATLVRRAAELGIEDYGISDHVHHFGQWADIGRSRREYLDACPSPRFHFGVEVSCVSRWELDQIAAGREGDVTYGIRQGGPPSAELAVAITPREIEAYGIEYVIGAAHWPMYVPWEREAIIREFDRQNTFVATHPLVTIVAHPWWWHGHWQEPDGMYRTDPWLDDFRKVPVSMHDEFAAAVIAHGKLVEVNCEAMLLNPGYTDTFKRQYLDYLAYLKSRRVRLTLGSDCHDDRYSIDFDRAARMLDTVGFTEGDFVVLPARPGQ